MAGPQLAADTLLHHGSAANWSAREQRPASDKEVSLSPPTVREHSKAPAVTLILSNTAKSEREIKHREGLQLKGKVCLDTELVPMGTSSATEETRRKLHFMPTSCTVTRCLERETATSQHAVSRSNPKGS